jgi:hypothetical protein
MLINASRDGRDGSEGRAGLEKDCLVGVDGGDGSAIGVAGPHWITAHALAAMCAGSRKPSQVSRKSARA